MSTLVLQAAGSAIGAAVGGPIGALVGRGIGAFAGAALDSQLFAPRGHVRTVEGPRLKTLSGLSSTEGAPIPRVYGRARVGGEIIWATRFQEQVSYRSTGGSRAGGKGGGQRGDVTVTSTYSYTANVAVGLCEGPIAFVRRIWADGRELDRSSLTIRVYTGTEDQEPDPLIVAKEGQGQAPAYRGLAYVVLEGLPLAPFGNRLPQLSFEVVRPVSALARSLRAVQVIPGAGEFVYAPAPVIQTDGAGTGPLNRHVLWGSSDWAASIDDLQALCPRLERVGLVVAWFGDDLRAGRCTIRPRVETRSRSVSGRDWRVAGLSRSAATTVSQVDGRPAYGGTPSDDSVIAAIRDLKARGLKVTLYPFQLMDIPAGNTLPDPWSGRAGQPAYPWRGRITVGAAPGRASASDATPSATAEIRAYFGEARPAHFAVGTSSVIYSGPAEWTLRRQVLHMAALARAAGGVDTIVIASELAALTSVRSAPGVYPAVAELRSLAADVHSLAGPGTLVTYAADWTEYGAHVLPEGELRFPLDPLWADPAIDAVAIDAWWPLADWRDGGDHLDAARARSGHDPDYLLANVTGGEGFDWYYPDNAARAAQQRHPIADAVGKPFVFRPKDLLGWWASPHVERVGGVEAAAPTAWVPRSKPIWLNEVGCPAIDKGANGPNAFPDPKSAEASRPPFSGGERDDLMLHRGLQAMLARFDPADPGVPDGANPVAPLSGGRMVDPSRIHAWAWDARPYPAFPAYGSVWGDTGAWSTGHWLTGRLEGAPVDDIILAMLADAGLPRPARVDVDGFLEGYVVDRPMSVRAALEPLAGLFGFDAIASGGLLRFADRRGRPVALLGPDDLVPDREGTLVRRTRAQETELPYEIGLAFADAEADYGRATVFSRRLAGRSRRQRSVEVSATLRREEAGRLVDAALHDAWVGRESVEFGLARRWMALEVGDLVTIPGETGGVSLRIERLRDAEFREVTARALEPSLFGTPARGTAPVQPVPAPPALPGRPVVEVVDWPGTSAGALQSLAVASDPWPRRMVVWRSVDGTSFEAVATAEAPATLGLLLQPCVAGPTWRFDDAASLLVRVTQGEVPVASDGTALEGRTVVALSGSDGAWELVAYARAELVAPGTWRLSRLLRGLDGSEAAAGRAVPAGQRIVLVDRSLVPLGSGPDAIGRAWTYRIGPAGLDVGDPTMVEVKAAADGRSLGPLAPVGIKARRSAAGVAISWIRRARRDSDAWEPVEVPLPADEAACRCEILGGGGVKRTLRGADTTLLYAAADEIADFGSPQTALSLRITLESTMLGPGSAWSGRFSPT